MNAKRLEEIKSRCLEPVGLSMQTARSCMHEIAVDIPDLCNALRAAVEALEEIKLNSPGNHECSCRYSAKTALNRIGWEEK